ncbi:holin [Streptomyces sp. NBC_01022]|uniref:holin n=1 Tax=Streptomyces sp. NBC_01022 TaxID=2903723 RepID=UPI002DD7CEF5|nr:holin [Streptomyces sp. NBC_01022]WRZ84861.1 holin [Streptomyces sp. NBC_01022]
MAAPIETKVTAATVMTFAVGIAAAVLNAVQADSSLLGSLPAWLQAPVLALVPAGLAFLAGYRARHTPRDTADPLAKGV